MSASVMQNLSRAPDAAATSLNDAHANGSDSIRTGLQLIPSPNDAQAALQSSASQIARLQANSQLPTARAAAEAYQTQAGAQTQVASTASANSSQVISILA